MIKSEFCNEHLSPEILEADGRMLTDHEMEKLWQIFVEIGHCWELRHTRVTDVWDAPIRSHHTVKDSANARSSWLEFIAAKTKAWPNSADYPDYTAEYRNAIQVVEDLSKHKKEPFRYLFLEYPKEANVYRANKEGRMRRKEPETRIDHAKQFVVDEFIAVQVIAGGFKEFYGRNYNGYLGGSRYNLKPRVRAYTPPQHKD